MSSYISREAAIAAAMRADDNGVSLEDAKKISRAVIAELESIPAVDVRPVVRGHWFPVGEITPDKPISYLCTHCKEGMIAVPVGKKMARFCPNCGAENEVKIDWNQTIPNIDQQLYRKYGLTQEEIDFIETHVVAMD